MEYSKEDLMEAKKQIWGVGENMGTEESTATLLKLLQNPEMAALLKTLAKSL